MFSRPVRSGWKPADTSISAPTRPRSSHRPSVGRRIFVSSFRTVDLPAPFGPMIPSASPRRASSDTSLSAQNSSRFSSCSPRTARLTSAGIRSRSEVCRSVRQKRFQTCSKVIPGCTHVRRSPQRRTRLDGRPASRRQTDRAKTAAVVAKAVGVRQLAAEQHGTVAVDDRRERIELEQDAERAVQVPRRIDHRRREHAHGDDRRRGCTSRRGSRDSRAPAASQGRR